MGTGISSVVERRGLRNSVMLALASPYDPGAMVHRAKERREARVRRAKQKQDPRY